MGGEVYALCLLIKSGRWTRGVFFVRNWSAGCAIQVTVVKMVLLC